MRQIILLALSFILLMSPSLVLAQTPSPSGTRDIRFTPPAAGQDYGDQVREERPDITYIVFKPAIIAWQKSAAASKKIVCDLRNLLARLFPSLTCLPVSP